MEGWEEWVDEADFFVGDGGEGGECDVDCPGEGFEGRFAGNFRAWSNCRLRGVVEGYEDEGEIGH